MYWNGTLEGSFGVELTGAILFPRPPPGFGGISNFIFLKNSKKLTKLMFSQHHFLVSLIDFYITPGSVVLPSGHFREYILHLTMALRWLHDIAKPSHTIHINIVCETTTSCIVRDCIGYNRVSIVCPSCVQRVSIGRLRTCFGSTFFFFFFFLSKFVTKIAQNSKMSYSFGHCVSKSARSDASTMQASNLADFNTRWTHDYVKFQFHPTQHATYQKSSNSAYHLANSSN